MQRPTVSRIIKIVASALVLAAVWDFVLGHTLNSGAEVAEVKSFIAHSKQITEKLGAVTDIKVSKIVSVQEGVSLHDEITEAYSLYTLKVSGTFSVATVEVRVSETQPASKEDQVQITRITKVSNLSAGGLPSFLAARR